MKFFETNGQLSLFAQKIRKVFKEEKVFQYTFFQLCKEREIIYDLHRNK